MTHPKNLLPTLLLASCGVGIVDFGKQDTGHPQVDTSRADSGDSGLPPDTGGPPPEPDIRIYPTAVEVGIVPLGCSSTIAFSLENWGDAPLEITGVSLSAGSDEFTLTATESTLGPLPWVVQPEAQVEVQVVYTPTDEDLDVAYLTVGSNDPDESEVAAGLVGNGAASDSVTETTPLPPPDVVVVLDTSGSMGIYLDSIRDAFPSLLDSLQVGGSDFRLTVVVQDSGCIQGDILYFDESTSSQALGPDYDDMVASDASGLDLERAFTLFQAAITQTGEGQCNEGLFRTPHQVHMVAISDEQEQSSAPWEDYVAAFQELVEEPADFYLHGIGGTAAGCAEECTRVADAAEATEGVFLSLCDAMDENMEVLGEAITERVTPAQISLQQPAVASTIQVAVDSASLSDGWSYDDGSNAVLFEEGAVQANATTIEISYAPLPDDCED